MAVCVFFSKDACPGMEVLLVDEDHNQFEQAEDGEEQGDDPAQFGDQVKCIILFWENPNHWFDRQVSLTHFLH